MYMLSPKSMTNILTLLLQIYGLIISVTSENTDKHTDRQTDMGITIPRMGGEVNIWFDNQCNKKINAVGRNDDQSLSLA